MTGAGLILRDKWYAGGLPQTLPSMASARSFFTMTLLPGGDILASGGEVTDGAYLASAERYAPESHAWVPAGAMATPRGGHTATLLPTGQVLVIGGQVSKTPDAFSSATERYDPTSNEWSTGPSMAAPRLLHTAVLLPDGQVVVLGGFSGLNYLQSAERLDPGAERSEPLREMTTPRVAAASVLLPNGEVLVVGGFAGSGYLATAERYDPIADRWMPAAAMAAARTWHTATLLPNGKVLVLGGYVLSEQRTPNFFLSAEVYDWTTDKWSAAASMSAKRSAHTATLLNTGQVLVAGGQSERVVASAEIFDTGSGAWIQARQMATPRTQHAAVLLSDGNVMVAGGLIYDGNSQATPTVEQYDTQSGRWSPPSTQ
jgi:hypothetical protein